MGVNAIGFGENLAKQNDWSDGRAGELETGKTGRTVFCYANTPVLSVRGEADLTACRYGS